MMSLSWSTKDVSSWGMVSGGMTEVLYPTDAEGVAAALREVSSSGGTIGLRGAGCSYGDASLNVGGKLLDFSRMNKILFFDEQAGEAVVEPGVTIRQLWRHAILHRLWPKVVPGTMEVTCGGAAAMNIHGKNNFAVGTFGDSIVSFKLITPTGETLDCDREQNSEVFHAAIGGFGMLGVFLEIRLKLKPVHCGRMRVTAFASHGLRQSLDYLEQHRGSADYLVGWLDLHARGSALGRGAIHRADHLQAGEDPAGEGLFDPALQDVPMRIFGIVPKGWIWPGMWAFLQGGLWKFVNAAKYRAGIREARQPPILQTHGAFHFLLDYVPNWKKMTSPGGLIQFQPFVPKEAAERVYRTLIERFQAAGLVPYLGVLKRHRSDPFLMTHAVDGYSLAMDFAVKKSSKERLWSLCNELAEIVLEAGGRFYYAKDAVLKASSFNRIHGDTAVAQFRSLKKRLDPRGILATDLSRRMLGECSD
ncbi:MAG: FAD-binding oxidoreductase [Planctomycetota bacterium]|nr:FAD-binding oxidoreductase [Planctomycetota bacterium]